MGTAIAHDSTSARATNAKTQDVFQTIVKSRKSYKMLKGAAEAVWPPYLEEALLKGFESYEPEDCRETRLLGRFPMRNQFISDYIHRVTGKRRTAKQVGSRLQQLRDTTEGKQLLNSLTQHYNLGGKHRSTPTSASSPDSSTSDGSSSSESAASSFSACSEDATPLDTSVRRTFVCIEVLPMDPTSVCSTYDEGQFFGSSLPAGGVFSSNGVTNVFRPSSHPRPICAIDPTITFVSRSVISAQSSCSVLLDGATVHNEVTPLTLAGSCPDDHHSADRPLLYGVKLVPSYWKSLCQSPDLTRYTIVQQVARYTKFPTPPGAKDDSLMFSAVYHFSYPQTGDYLSPSLPSTPVIGDEADSFMASPLTNQLSDSWYSDLLSPTDIGSPPDSTRFKNPLTGHEECGRSVLTLDGDIGTSRESLSENTTILSPISSCFPTDLSNYIV